MTKFLCVVWLTLIIPITAIAINNDVGTGFLTVYVIAKESGTGNRLLQSAQ